jgi:hypothetical protein
MGPNNPDVIVNILEAKNAELAELRAKLAEATERVGKLDRELGNYLDTLHAVVVIGLGLPDPLKGEGPAWGDFKISEAVAKLRAERDDLLATNKTHAAEFAYAQKALDEIAEICGDTPSDPGHVVPAVRSIATQRDSLRGAAELGLVYAKVMRQCLENSNPYTFVGSSDQAEIDGDIKKISDAIAAERKEGGT